MDQKSLQDENEKLKKEIEELKRVLWIVKLWMEKEVKASVTRIAKNKLSKLTDETKRSFFNDNIENIITKTIYDFFGEILILNIPSSVINNIISAEINYYHLKENPISDWLSVISSYQKSLDILIESYITKWFRKFVIKRGDNILRKNDSIEKALNSVVNSWYILGVWRLFHLLKLIKNDEEIFGYWKAFKDYLEKYSYLKDILFDEKFYSNLSEIVESEILWKKRHSWRITFVETRAAREIFVWNFKNKDCLIYKLIETQNLNF